MNTKESRRKIKGIVRFTGGGALLMAIIGLIIFSPLSAGEQGARHVHGNHEAGAAGRRNFGAAQVGLHRFGIGSEDHISFLEIVLDLSGDQVEELEPILAEQHEKTAELRGENRMYSRQAMRMKRMHRGDHCDKVDQTEMRANMRRQRREFEKDRDRMLKRMEMHRAEFDKKLAEVLDDGQMKKYRELRELREDHREEWREHRKELREQREELRERRDRKI